MEKNNRKELPQWLIDVQNNSYMPELLISGAILFVLFSLDKHIIFLGYNVREYILFPMINIVLITAMTTLLSALTGIKIILIIHLVLRMVWIGFVGLSFVFPSEGDVDNIKSGGLFARKFENQNSPTEAVLSLERICSLAYSFAMLFVFMMLGIMILFSVFVLLVNLSTVLSIIYLVILSIYVIDLIAAHTIRNTNMGFYLIAPGHILVKYAGMGIIYRRIFHVFRTQIGHYKTLLLILAFLVIGLLTSYPHLTKFLHRKNILDTRNFTFIVDDSNYEDKNTGDVPLDHMTINSYYQEISGTMTLFVLFHKYDDIIIEEIADTEPELVRQNYDYYLNKINQIFVDDSLFTNLSWVMEKHEKTNQLGIRTRVSLEGISPGKHRIEFKKLRLINEEFEYRTWEYVMFEITR